MPPTVAELFASPDHYMHAFEGDAAVFVTMDRAAYRRSIFLDARIAPAIPEPIRVPLTPLVKANVPVNFILPEVSAADSAAPAIFLYLGLRDYCLAILRSAPHRAWLRQVCGLLGSHLDRFDPASDGERAAALWLAQVGRFAAALEAMPHARSLDGERLLEHPAQTVTAAASALDLPLTPARSPRCAQAGCSRPIPNAPASPSTTRRDWRGGAKTRLRWQATSPRRKPGSQPIAPPPPPPLR